MVAGVHSVQFTVVASDADKHFTVGIGTHDNTTVGTPDTDVLGIHGHTGDLEVNGDSNHEYQGNPSRSIEWIGQEPFAQGDEIGLVLNFRLEASHACLTVYKNGVRLGIPAAIKRRPGKQQQKLFWTVRIEGTDNASRLKLEDWQPPSMSTAEVAHEMTQFANLIQVRADDTAVETQENAQARAVDREEAAEWVTTLSSAVAGVISALDELPGQFTDHDTGHPIAGVELGEAEYPDDQRYDLRYSFPVILDAIPALRNDMQNIQLHVDSGW